MLKNLPWWRIATAVLRRLFTVRPDPSAFGAKGLDL
jgi:hypothetical protein